MNRSALNVESRFEHDLGEGRMSVAAAGEVFAASAKVHRNRRFGDQVPCSWANRMDAQNTI